MCSRNNSNKRYVTPDTTETLSNKLIKLQDGTAALPSLTFAADEDTGLYRVGANSVGVSTNGVLRTTVSDTHVTSTLPIRITGGTSSAPGVEIDVANGTGLYGIAGSGIGLSAVTVPVLAAYATGAYVYGKNDSTATAPAYTFVGDNNTGIYPKAADQIGFAVGGAAAGSITSSGFVPVSTGSSYGSGLSYLAEYSATATMKNATNLLTDFITGAGTFTLTLTRINNIVFATFAACTGTAAGSTRIYVAIPTEFRPSGTTPVVTAPNAAFVYNNSTQVVSVISAYNAGYFEIQNASGNFTGGTTCGWYFRWTGMYHV